MKQPSDQKDPEGALILPEGSAALVPTQARAEKEVVRLQYMSDLAPGYLMLPGTVTGFSITAEDKGRMAVWILNNQAASSRFSKLNERKRVWLLTVAGIEKLHYHNYKASLKRGGFDIEEHRQVDIGMLHSLYEDNSDDVKSAEITEDNDLSIFYKTMVGHALKEGVSDIHVERRRNRAMIRMRKHGQLLDYQELGAKYTSSLCSVIYNVLAENKDVNFLEDDYQAAAVNTFVDGVEVKLRYQSLPVYPGGFDVILRVLPIGSEDETFVDLEKLGYAASQVHTLLDVARRPVGAMIIAGTTGSGKSTTLKNLLMFINASRGYKCKIYTIEDPPEYRIPKVSQIPVVRRKSEQAANPNKSPFYDPLIATMRGDPDILMIGEIRDMFTGDGLKKATQSGHQVLTTVHASSALGIIERLADFGISPSVMGSPEFLTGLIYQKLVPILCHNCAEIFSSRLESSNARGADLELAERLKDVVDFNRDTIKIAHAGGCDRCGGMGVTGRTVCAEIIAPDFNMLKLFREQKAIEAYAYWRGLSDRDPMSTNMKGKTCMEHALTKMRLGIVSPYDIEELFGPVNNAELQMRQMLDEEKRRSKEDRRGGGRLRAAWETDLDG